MTPLPDSARALIESGALAHRVTLKSDRSPQVSGVWVGLDGDEIVMGHIPLNAKVRNLRRDSRIVLSLQADDRNEIGMQHQRARQRPGIGLPLNTYFCASATGS